MSVFERFGKVVRAEWSHLRGRRASSQPSSTPPAPAASGGNGKARTPRVVDVDGALRVLELNGTPSLDDVRARYHELSRRYYPKALSPRGDEAHAARVVLDALTDALELLEEHLLPAPET